ncbi:MAG: sugar transferase [Cyanobacteriota bacterium]
MRHISRQVTVLFLVDLILFLLVFGLIFLIRPETFKYEFILTSLCVVFSWHYVLYLKGFYTIKEYSIFWKDSYHILEAILIGSVLPMIVSYFWQSFFIPRGNIIFAAVMSYFVILLWRFLFSEYMKSFKKHKNVIIIGAGRSGTTIAKEIISHPELNYDIVGFVDDDNEKIGQNIEGFKVLGPCTELSKQVKENDVNILILAITGKPKHHQTLFAVAECMKLDVKFFDMVNLYSYLTGKIPINYITNSWFIYELGTPNKPFYEAIKRLLDIIMSLTVLIVTSPIIIFLAFAIKFQDGGNILYSQDRVGRHGKVFKMLKLRTMIANAERDGAVWAANNDEDPRVTKIGKIARKLRFDELPQMYNIIKGDMSLVGPRPERPEFTCELEKQIPFYQRRHWVVPGWTGWAQIMFRYGASVDDAHEKLQFDFYYIKNRSIFLDISIFIKAVGMALSGRHG